MKKYLKPDLLPFLTVILGASVLFCRVWLLLGGIDTRGLYISGHFADTLSYILLACTALGIWLCIRNLQGGGRMRNLFPASLPGALGCFVGGIGIFAAGLLEVPKQTDLIWFLSLAVGSLAGVALALTGIARLKGRRTNYWLHCAVTVYFLVHLISRYRVWSSEPQLQEYFFPLLCSVFLLLCTYQRTCLDAGFGSRKYFAFFNQLALFCALASVTTQDWLFYLSMALWTLTSLCDVTELGTPDRMRLPANVLYCIGLLEHAGYKAYAVGGCVRDHLLGLTPHDYDLCTDATPEQIAEVFANCELVRAGEKHGTVGVVLDGTLYEITTFRTEGSYSDARHPDSVEFVTSLRTDLARRDFTVNTMAYAPRGGYVDPFGGRYDLHNKVLRSVGDPQLRFREDALRILRGVRFALRFDLTPEAETLKAMLELAPSMDQLASERIFSELSGILPLLTAKSLKTYQPIITQVIPELAACVDFQQHSRHHAYDVYTHTAYVTEAVESDLALRLAALLHDVGKPEVFYQDEDGSGHFPAHAQVGAQKADEILRRLKAPNALREQVVFLIDHHMTPFEPDRTLLRRRLSQYGEENCRLLLQLQKADFCSKGVEEEGPDFGAIEAMLEELLQENACLQTKDLAVNGRDLLELGFEAGPMLGQAMQTLLQQVVDETLPNEKDALLEQAKALLEEEK